MANKNSTKDCEEKLFVNDGITLLRSRLGKALRLRADVNSVVILNEIVVIYKTGETEIRLLRNCSKFFEWNPDFIHPVCKTSLHFCYGAFSLIHLNVNKIQRKREEICKIVTSDNVEIKWILDLNVRSIDLDFEELDTMIESFGVNKPSLTCCSETWMVESPAEDLYDIDNYAPMKFQPGKNRNEGVAIYVHESTLF